MWRTKYNGPTHIADVINWSQSNLMNINWKKTKEMCVGPIGKHNIPLLNVDGHIVQRVNVFKLLGVTVDSNLKWENHVHSICSKASSRLYFLLLLRRSSVSKCDLLHFCESYIRPILEYACPVWHSSLTNEQCQRIETIQRRAMSIIDKQSDYLNVCKANNLLTLYERREMLCRTFFNSIFKSESCLNYLLPSPRCSEAVSKLRHYSNYIPNAAKSERYKHSF